MKRKFSKLDEKMKKALFDAFCFNAMLKKKTVLVEKQKDFALDTEYHELDDNDKKVIALFWGVLNSTNEVSEKLAEKGIVKSKILQYLNLDITETRIQELDKLVIDPELIAFVGKIFQTGKISLSHLTFTLYRNFFCESDIIANFYYSCISLDRHAFINDKEMLENLQRVQVAQKLNKQINFDYSATVEKANV